MRVQDQTCLILCDPNSPGGDTGSYIGDYIDPYGSGDYGVYASSTPPTDWCWYLEWAGLYLAVLGLPIQFIPIIGQILTIVGIAATVIGLVFLNC